MFGIVLIYESVHALSFVPILSFLINNPCSYILVVIYNPCSYISCRYSKRENSHAPKINYSFIPVMSSQDITTRIIYKKGLNHSFYEVCEYPEAFDVWHCFD